MTHQCTDGWIVETVDGARIVTDRCPVCNPSPWQQRQQIRSWRSWLSHPFVWLLLFVLLSSGSELCALEILMWFSRR